jgi:hypothetical protein
MEWLFAVCKAYLKQHAHRGGRMNKL